MNYDISEFLCFLESLSISHEAKQEVAQSLWRLMNAQADIAFETHPLQLSREQKVKKALRKNVNSLDSKTYPISYHYGRAANDDCPTSKKGGQKNASGQ